MEKLNINLFPEGLKDEYNKERAEFIANYEEYSFWGRRREPEIGKAEWNKIYPTGFGSWANNNKVLSSTGQQMLINKVNELIEKVNELENKK